MTDDAVLSALESVDVHGDPDDPGAGDPAIGEEADARPEGPLPDPDADHAGDEFEDDESSGGFDPFEWARSVPEGSHTDFDATDWWDPEGGAENRLAFHLADATGAGAGYPNGLGVLVAIGELYWSKVREQQSGGSSSDESAQEAPDAETVDRNTAEGLV